MDLYIYYRVLSDRANEFQARAIDMQTMLAKKYSVRTELKRRPDEKDKRHTWMEVYRNAPGKF